MSNYTVPGTAPIVVFPLEAPAFEDTMIKNTGSATVYLLDNPGLYINGFKLAPSATKEWPQGRPLYVQAEPGMTSTIETSPTGAYGTPSPLNAPKVLWLARAVPTLDGSPPGTAGLGPNFFGTDTSFGVPNPADTGYIDISNYSSVIITAVEQQNPVTSANDEVRRMKITWYTKLDDGTYFAVSQTNHFHICIPSQTLAFPGYDGLRNPQFRMVTPARANFVRIRIFDTTFTTPVAAGRITYNLQVVGDNRPIQVPYSAYDCGYYVNQEDGTYNNVDMSDDDIIGGTFSMPIGTTTLHASHKAGPAIFNCRFTSSAATVQGTRVQISGLGLPYAPGVIRSFDAVAGITGTQSFGGPLNLPDRPIILVFNNAQALAQTFVWSLVVEKQ